jgi:hypothetical protein
LKRSDFVDQARQVDGNQAVELLVAQVADNLDALDRIHLECM